MNTLLGQRIREQRKEKGWTIEQFAERVELSANYVGETDVQQSSIFRIAQIRRF